MTDPVRILAVDDSLTIRKALELILVPAGYQVAFAASGAEALAIARQAPPDVLLLDFILPDLRGSDVCRSLREEAATAALPVVLISARGAEIEQAFRDLPNVVRYLGKPFTPDEVLTAVTDALAAELPAVVAGAAVDALPELAAADPPAGARAAVEALPTPALLAIDPATTCAAALDAFDDPDTTVAPPSPAPRPPSTDWLFETLRDGLEGVFVEELETPAGALADRAQSYTDLAARVRQQLGEALQQAESGAPYTLCDDGSIRSLGETLLDGYRRVCRLVFRAAAAGVLTPEPGDSARPRVLVACHHDSPVYASLSRAVAEADDWQTLQVASDFRQLPATVRLFGPTHVLIDGAAGGPVWDQLALVRRLPEGQRLQCIGVLAAGAAAYGAGGLFATVPHSDDLLAALRSAVRPQIEVSL